MKAMVDRIEGPVAVLLTCEAESFRITVPATLLPPETREGDVLTLTLAPDPDGTRAAKDRTSGLIRKLSGRR